MSASLCYSLSGEQSPYNDIGYIPCNQTAVDSGQHTACCAPGDACMTNGLCQNAIDHNLASNRYWRVGCTDKTFKDAACPKYCEDIDIDVLNHVVYKCSPSTTWCCGTGGDPALWPDFSGRNSTCCNVNGLTFDGGNVDAYMIAGAGAIASASASSSPSTTTSSLASTSTDSNTTVPHSHEGQPGTSSNVKIGIGVGVPVAIFLIGALCLLIFVLKKRRRQPEDQRGLGDRGFLDELEAPALQIGELRGQPRSEMAGTRSAYQLPDVTRPPVELYGTRAWPGHANSQR